MTSRPDTEGRAWELRFHAQRNYPHRLTEVALTPLTPADTERLTGNLLHVRDLPERLARQVLERSEGNPFFLEEILRTLIERGTLAREGDRWVAREDSSKARSASSRRRCCAERGRDPRFLPPKAEGRVADSSTRPQGSAPSHRGDRAHSNRPLAR